LAFFVSLWRIIEKQPLSWQFSGQSGRACARAQLSAAW